MSLTVSRRRHAGVPLALALGGAAAQGCAFPEIDFSGGGGTDGTASTTPASVGTESSAQTGTTTTASGTTTTSSTGGESSSSGFPADCDEDGDDYMVERADCCVAGTNGPCDCDDGNGDVNPGRIDGAATAYVPSTGGSPSFDYDCDGVYTPDWERGGCNSPTQISCNGALPSEVKHFASAAQLPGVCGQGVNVYGCHPPATTCDQLAGTQPLPCR